MKVIQESAASPAAVWAVLTDLDRFAQIADVLTLERLDDGSGFGIGTRWRQTRRMFGRNEAVDLTVTEIVPGHGYSVETVNKGTSYRSVMAVEPAGSGSQLTMELDATNSNVIAKALGATLGRLLEGVTRSVMQQDLAAITAAAESDEGIVGTDTGRESDAI